ncbi:hypothetical protein C9374_005060 [Naegleria lovaniensis]|uniref:Secreted protein n=1 Tax=Naegleria lovaniensis TaxID=51637 RepID=A0AA88GLL4_NAELO|nr:uncharacterized protein C9374_005060 [Naegleria lovaniensis]KAG2382480.1 hypothetical protein C9374_005060 [Naegleria lovaniensis]
MRVAHFFALLVLVVFMGCIVECQQPATPIWPPTFKATFTERLQIFKWLSPSTTNGTYYYDAANNRQRIDRADGAHDRYCGTVHFGTNTPCTHLVVEDKRYLVFPELKSCCMCCTSENGCGVLSRDWLKNATYIGQTVYNGYHVNQWDKEGLQHNYYYETIGVVKPIAIDQQPNDLMVFNANSYSEAKQDSSLFAIPSYCKDESTGSDHKCPFFSICTIAAQQRIH